MSLTAAQLDAVKGETLTLDENHVYHLGMITPPPLSRVLASAGLCDDFSMVPPHILNRKRDIGKAVHKAAELYLLGILDETTVVPDCQGYFSAFKRYYDSIGNPEPEAVETPLWTDDPWLYAATPDICWPDGGVTEIKTSAKLSPYVGVQLAGQANCIARGDEEVPRIVVQLCKDGTFAAFRHSDSTDFAALAYALGVYHWKHSRNLI